MGTSEGMQPLLSSSLQREEDGNPPSFTPPPGQGLVLCQTSWKESSGHPADMGSGNLPQGLALWPCRVEQVGQGAHLPGKPFNL